MRLLITSAFAVSAIVTTGFMVPQEPQEPARPRPKRASSFQTPAALAPTWRITNQRPVVGQIAPAVTYPKPPSPSVASPFAGVSQNRLFYSTRTSSREERGMQTKIDSAVRDLKSDDDEKKAAAEDKLREAVEEMFDARSKSREAQIKDLEKRINSLRDQLQQRRDKKAEICRLHVQTLVNQANGLGF